jgi:hypothetical protein
VSLGAMPSRPRAAANQRRVHWRARLPSYYVLRATSSSSSTAADEATRNGMACSVAAVACVCSVSAELAAPAVVRRAGADVGECATCEAAL